MKALAGSSSRHKTITKKELEDAYRKFKPNRLETFFMKYVSISSLSQNNWPAVVISIYLMVPLIGSIIIEILGLPNYVLSTVSWIYILLLSSGSCVSLVILIRRKIRILNIVKELDTSRDEYEKIVEKYYYENYYPDIKDFIHNMAEENEKRIKNEKNKIKE